MKYLVAIGLLVFIASCMRKEHGEFTVSGNIKNAPEKMIYLEQLPFTSANSMVIDSAALSENSSYKLKGNGTEEGLYVLSFNHVPAIIFINDDDNIQIDFDINDFRHPQVKGSDATNKLYAFINSYRAKDSLLAKIYNQIDFLQKENESDSLLQVLQDKGTAEMKKMNDEIKNFVNTSKSPAAISFVLDKAKNSMSLEEINALATTAANKFKEHSGLAAFKAMAAQAMASSPSASYSLLNQQAPDLTMNSANGKPVSISSFKGKYLLVDFWASWCAPCRQENPNVVKAYQKFKNKNFDILGVSLDADKDAWVEAIKRDNLTWTQISDLKQWESEAVSTYKFDGIPFNVLIDPQGKIIASSLRGPALEQKLQEVLQ